MEKIGATFLNIIEIILRWFLNIIFHLLKKDVPDSLVNNLMQFVKFGMVGVSNTVISYILYSGSLLIMKSLAIFPKLDYLIAQVIQYLLSVLWSFYWNNKYVFQLNEGEHRSLFKSLLKTYASYSFTGLFLNSVLLVLWIQVFHISEFIAPIINLFISIPINFLISKIWAFRKE